MEDSDTLQKFLFDNNLSEQDLKKIIKQTGVSEPLSYNHKKLDYNGKHIKFTVVSDLHMGHKEYKPEILDHAIRNSNRQGSEMFLLPGDILEGMSGREGHIYELDHIGASNQLDYAVEQLSKIKQPIYAITATNSHDGWYSSKNNMGFEVGPELERRLDNFNFLGYDEADLKLDNGLDIRMVHPGGGTAYAISYKGQKYLNSISGGDKPDINLQGHYHKALYMFYRNVHHFEAGTLCFTGNTGVLTSEGIKKISAIKEGDFVLTHNNRFMKVIKKHKRMHEGSLIKIYFGRKNSESSRITPTKEHPILIERNGVTYFEQAKNIRVGDWIVVLSNKCKYCGKQVPYYNIMCDKCNPMHLNETRIKLSETRGPFKRDYSQNGSVWKHLRNDIIPHCEKMKNDGWITVPVGAGVIPDIVGFKDGKVKLVELESKHGLGLERKKKKYENAPIMNYVDEVEWIDCYIKKERENMRDFKDYKQGFVKVKVLSVEKYNAPKRNKRSVYNLTVEEDNTYVAGNVLVHNCGQTSFMKKMGTPAMTGYWIIDAHINKKGVDRIKSEFVPFY